MSIKTQCGRQRPAPQQPCPTPAQSKRRLYHSVPVFQRLSPPIKRYLFVRSTALAACCPVLARCPILSILSCPGPGAVAVLAGEKTKPKPISPKTKAPSSSDAPVSCRVSPLSLSHPHRPATAALRETHNLHHLPSSSSIKLALYASKFVHFSQLLHPNHI